MPTLSDLAADVPDLAAVADDAARRGLAVGDLLGAGGYAAAFEADSPDHGPCVLKVPWATPRCPGSDSLRPGDGPNRAEPEDPTGPIILRPPGSPDEAAALLARACGRQRQAGNPRPLAAVLDVLELGGRPAALVEWAPGDSLRHLLTANPDRARAAVPAVARAIARLHAGFGPHGDLKPDHVFVDGAGEVTLIDPLGVGDGWLGSVGYVLPWDGSHQRPVRDLVALVGVLADVWGGATGWTGRVLHRLLNGRFGWSEVASRVPAWTRARLWPLPPSARDWAAQVTRVALPERPVTDPAASGEGDAGWCRDRLEALARTHPVFRPGWRTADVAGLGRGALAGEAERVLPLLADALMDAGCDDPEVLAACRADGPVADRLWVAHLAAGVRPSGPGPG